MDKSTRNSERITAIVSTVVAVVILAAGVTAQQSRYSRSDELTYLESDLRFQLESAFRLNPKQGATRLQLLEGVLASWRESPQTQADRELLSTWLLEATIRSMPGSIEALPPAPTFGQSEPVDKPTPAAARETELPVSAPAQAVAHGDILFDSPVPTEPFVPGLTPDLAPPLEPVAEHTLVSAVKPAPSPKPEPTAPAVTINLTELAARIAGYHQGLNELKSALLADEHPQVESLVSQISSLESLANDYQFARLYFDALTPEERQSMIPPRSLKNTLTELRRHLDRLQDELEADFLGEFDAAVGEQLANLRGQLDAIVNGADW